MKKKAKGNITWVDDEVVGFKCECGNNDLTIGIYEDHDYSCLKCKRNYILEQRNIVWEIKNK